MRPKRDPMAAMAAEIALHTRAVEVLESSGAENLGEVRRWLAEAREFPGQEEARALIAYLVESGRLR